MAECAVIVERENTLASTDSTVHGNANVGAGHFSPSRNPFERLGNEVVEVSDDEEIDDDDGE